MALQLALPGPPYRPKPAKRRSSVEAKDMAVPVLQSKLRTLLGKDAKLPKKKAELLKLYTQHCG